LVDNPWFVAGLAIVTSLLASSGFWAYIQRKDTQKSARNRLVLGLAHDLMLRLATEYVRRGSLTRNEYDSFINILYKPYIEMGGNGLIEKAMVEIDSLPIREKERND
jgi:hypothetical protein